MKSLILFALSLPAALAVGQITVYDMNDAPLYGGQLGRLATVSDEWGDQVLLAGTERAVTEMRPIIRFEDVANYSIDVTARLRSFSAGMPGPVLWMATQNVQGGQGTYYVTFPVPNIVVPDELVWSIQLTRLSTDPGKAGPLAGNNVAVGSSSLDFFWVNFSQGGWSHWNFGQPDPGGNLACRIRAVAASATILPTSTTLNPGIVISGTPQDLYTSNDMYYVLRPGLVLSSSQSPIVLTLSGTAPGNNPNMLKMVVESHANQSNIRETIETYDFNAAAYETLNQTVISTADVSRTLDITNPAQHVGPGNEVRTRISYRAVGPVLNYPWRAYLDEATWRYSN